ncbi:unnamed protein product [Protopolystoma xenopodis]|uniref:Uncharacterized protein n=1 Tax=Protopolystoma xenopodis TaxID=117903 RepID=A0A448XBJ0_9PLAT|nr:unnamed protein product [Protopolystoma xenopodis]
MQRVLIPLHKSPSLASFHPQLVYCITEFLRKDSTLVKPLNHVIMNGLLRFWPRVVSGKEVLFLNELEDCMLSVEPFELTSFIEPIFKRIATCILSSSFQDS